MTRFNRESFVFGAAMVMAGLDVMFTHVGLTNGGNELNPFAAHLWETSGFLGLLLGKLVLFGLVYLSRDLPYHPRVLWLVMWVQTFAACWGMITYTLELVSQ